MPYTLEEPDLVRINESSIISKSPVVLQDHPGIISPASASDHSSWFSPTGISAEISHDSTVPGTVLWCIPVVTPVAVKEIWIV